MAKRTKLQKKHAEERRRSRVFFTQTGVSFVASDLVEPTSILTKKIHADVIPTELTARITRDISKTVVISFIIFVLLFGIYFYLR